MKKKSKSKIAPKKRTASKAAGKVVKSTTPRNSPVPKITARKEITHEMIAKRAYEISLGGQAGDEMHNWLLAERELRAG